MYLRNRYDTKGNIITEDDTKSLFNINREFQESLNDIYTNSLPDIEI